MPILTEKVNDLPQSPDSVKLDGQITILGFLGNKIEQRKGNVFNLNQKIYKRFNGFKDLQFVMVVPEGSKENVQALKKELGSFTDTQNWKFVYSTPSEIKELFESLQTNLNLDDSLFTPHVFIIDKERNLRGRNDDEDEGVKYGFNTSSVADLNNKMEDDVKIILAEYRLALKKNNADRSK